MFHRKEKLSKDETNFNSVEKSSKSLSQGIQFKIRNRSSNIFNDKVNNFCY